MREFPDEGEFRDMTQFSGIGIVSREFVPKNRIGDMNRNDDIYWSLAMDEEKVEMTLLDTARSICGAALDAVDPGWLVRTNVVWDGDKLRVVGEAFDFGSFEKVWLIAFGKAAAGMAEALAEILADRLSSGLVIAPAAVKGRGMIKGKLEFFESSHPLPDGRSVEAARRALALAEKAGARDLVFVCISGGGSSLLCLPAEGISLEEKSDLTRKLLRAGASIRELNVVRKHLSGIKGGRLAQAAAPATLVSLIISDVNGDDLETIASGPTDWDSSAFADAREILERYGLWEKAPASVRARIEAGDRGEMPETLKSDDPVFENAHAFVIGNNLTALRGARRRAEGLGFEPFILTSTDEGEACKAAHDYAAFIAGLACSMSTAPKPVCLLAGGELTVEVRGKGRGGRNTEFVLASLLEFAREEVASALSSGLEWLVLSIGTDGVDGPTDAAGAWADAAILDRAKLLGLDAEASLDDNDSYSFFEKTGNLVITGPTGTNVCDVRIFLIRPV
jgi:glycerate 2-kinase